VLASLSACEKKPAKGDTGAVNALDRAGSETGPVDETPLPGIDVSKLSTDKQKLFYKLVGSLTSPCKAESLRAGFTKDTECKRAPFAVRYLASLVDEELTEAEVREFYDKKYTIKPDKPIHFDVSKAPKHGTDDAPVMMYEFFDYECPHCAAFKPMLDLVLKGYEGKVVLYYMMFPLDKHSEAKSAAQAAVAANELGKFQEMHDMLFEKTPIHSREAVIGYAKELGLDEAKFTTLYDSAAAQVTSDIAQGDAAGVDATPTLFFNDRKYEGPMHPRYIAMWIDEELAVNR
jgi:protein-disulfide isomerase